MPMYARLWVDILGDPKLLAAVDEGAQNLDPLPWLIAFAKRADAEGRIEIDGKPATGRQIAREIPNVTPRKISKSMEELAHIGVLTRDPDGCYRFAAWEFRNSSKTSDSKEAIKERVRKHRERKRGNRERRVTGSNALQGVTDVTDVTSRRVESREEREESREKRNKAGSSGRESRRERNALQLPPAAADFGRIYYGDATPDRKRDIRRQLLATLNGGATLRSGVRVRAVSVERLEAKCREVIADGVKDHDKAIVVLLTKLGDISDTTPPGLQEAQQLGLEEKRATADGAQRLAHALAWLETDPAAAAAVTASVDEELGPVDPKADPASVAMLRRICHNAAVLKAWTDAGEPIVQPAGGK